MRRATLLFAVSVGTACGLILGGLVIGAISLLGDRPAAESALVFAVALAAFALAGALYGFQAWRETPADDHGVSDA
jgi:NhaP-type Na+/H+ or K+/H+ antiporter